jgi:hypothetical protein
MTKYYSQHAERLFSECRRIDPEEIHSGWVKSLPSTPGLACDIGAGSGRDADLLAKKGWNAIPVENFPKLTINLLIDINK